MKELQIFESKRLGKLTVVGKENKYWFIASDVCKILGIKNTTNAIKALEKDERSKFDIGRSSEVNIIAESGMHYLISKSRKPIAKSLKRWLIKEVLPLLRNVDNCVAVKLKDITSGCIDNKRVKDMIKITQETIGEEEVNAVNARDLHEFLEVGKDFSTWIKNRIKQYDFIEGIDFVCSPVLGNKGRGGHNAKEYIIAIDMAKELSMVERNDKGKEARKYFIEMEKKAKKLQQAIPDFNNPAEAARAWALEYEEKQLAYKKIEEDKPKVEYYDKVLDSTSTFTTTQIAKEAEMTAQQLNLVLQQEGVQFKQSDQWMLMKGHQDKGYTNVRTHVAADNKTYHRTVWTEKGREFILNLLEDI